MDSRVDVILPAGGRVRGRFAAQLGTEVKALIELGGQTLLAATLDTLRATGRVQRSVVIGPKEVAEHRAARGADAVLLEAGSGPGNILRGLEWLQEANSGHHPHRVLIIGTDLPFLTPQAVTGFLDACPAEADISLPVMRREALQARFPAARRGYVHLRDGGWTMGSASLVSPAALVSNRIYVEHAFAGRKIMLALAWRLGPAFLLRFAFRQLTVTDIQRRCEQMLACACCAVLDCAPELAFDIDRLRDYRYAVAHLATRSPAT